MECSRGERLSITLAKDQINQCPDRKGKAKLEVDIFELLRDSEYETAETMCQILTKGVLGVLGPSCSPSSSSIISNICGEKEVPHIKVSPEESTRIQLQRFTTLNLHPSNTDISAAVAALLYFFNSTAACLICAKAECLLNLEKLLRQFLISKDCLSVRMLDDKWDPTPLLKEIRDDKTSTVIVHANASMSYTILTKAAELGMVSAYYTYIFTNLEFSVLQFNSQLDVRANVLGFSMFNQSHSYFQEFVHLLQQSWEENCDHSPFTGPSLSAALMFDAVYSAVSAVHELNRSQEIGVKSLSCGSSQIWPHGTSLMNYLRMVELEGLTGHVEFSSKGQRTNYELKILQYTKLGFQQIGKWHVSNGLSIENRYLSLNHIPESIINKTLIVTTILENPYLMLKTNHQEMDGNDRYEGFCVDMLQALANILQFSYKIHLVADGVYGAPELNGTWTGMVGELISRPISMQPEKTENSTAACERGGAVGRQSTRHFRSHPRFLCKLHNVNERYYVDIELQDNLPQKIVSLIDTGSQPTILSSGYFQKVLELSDRKPRLETSDATLVSVAGTPLKVLGTANLDFKLGNKVIRHPTLVVDLPHDRLIIGMDFLKRLNPIIDFINEVIWSQVKVPISYEKSQSHHAQRSCHVIEERPDSIEVHFRNSQTPDVSFLKISPLIPGEQEDNTISVSPERIRDICLEGDVLIFHLHKERTEPNGHSDHSQFLTGIEKINEEVFFPILVNDLARTKRAKLDLRQENSYISRELLNQLANPKVIRFPNPQDDWIQDLDNDSVSHNIIGKCMLSISIGGKAATHLFLVLNEPRHQVYIGNDVVHRFAMQVDLINSHIWTRLKENPCDFTDGEKALKSCQALPYAVSVQLPYEVRIPPGSVNCLLPLQVRKGQKLKTSDALICLSNRVQQLGILANPTPMVNIHHSRTQIIINNNSPQEILLPKDTLIGLALDSDYYTDGFQNAVIGSLPEQYLKGEINAETCDMLLINHIFSRLGLPQRIEFDRGSHFTSEVMTKMWKILGVKRKLHIAYRAASSGGVERYNQSIVTVLKKFVKESGKDWDMKLPLVLMAIRATPSTATKMSPFELMTGRRMVLPQHLLYRTSDQNLINAATTHQYTENLRQYLQQAFAFAQRNLERAAVYNKTYYDLKTTKKEYEIDDKVYLYNFARDRVKERKFLPSWKGPYSITDKISPVVYKIEIPKGTDRIEKWVHINQLRVCHPRSQLRMREAEPERNA